MFHGAVLVVSRVNAVFGESPDALAGSKFFDGFPVGRIHAFIQSEYLPAFLGDVFLEILFHFGND